MDDQVLNWDEARISDAIASIVADAETAFDGYVWPGHPLDNEITPADQIALYLGTAGMIWALHRLGSSLDLAACYSRSAEKRAEFAEQHGCDAAGSYEAALDGADAVLLATPNDDHEAQSFAQAMSHVAATS